MSVTYESCLEQATTSIWCDPMELSCYFFIFHDNNGDAKDDGHGAFFVLSLLFLLYHICHHSFIKSCYLKKCLNVCVLGLFSFMFWKWADHVTYWRSQGAVWPSASRGRHAEMQRRLTDWMKCCCLSAHHWQKPISLLCLTFDVFVPFRVKR